MGRKNKNTYLGNTLDKPGLLLKREKVKDTTEDKEKLYKDANRYNKNYVERVLDQDKCYNLKDQIHHIQKNLSEVSIREFYKNPGTIKCNLKLDNNNNLIIDKSEYEKYSLIYAIVNTNNQTILVPINTNNNKIDKFDLRLKESQKKNYI